ncbi:MAG: DUF1801 domain-containing protein [Chitinophagaceae bacterium]|nr:DUF1801 domain-containing protein [Chitinophagaceae bacterium]
MMAEIKANTKQASVPQFLTAVADEEKRKDSKILLKLFTEITKEKAALWGNAVIGFGKYHYQSERSKQAGDWFMTGFSPRKQNLTIYIIPGTKKYASLIKKLGKFTVSAGSCVYIKRLSEIDIDVLKELVRLSFEEMKMKHG